MSAFKIMELAKILGMNVAEQDRDLARALANDCANIQTKIDLLELSEQDKAKLRAEKKKLVKARIEALGMELIKGGKYE